MTADYIIYDSNRLVRIYMESPASLAACAPQDRVVKPIRLRILKKNTYRIAGLPTGENIVMEKTPPA